MTSTDSSVWNDGVPSGTGKIWMTSRTFASDDAYSDSAWKTPRVLADTEFMDYEFSSEENPGTRGTPQKASPSAAQTNPYWSNTADEHTIWMAMREISNGAYKAGSTWMIVKVKGEKGADGTSVTPLGSIFGSFNSVADAQSYYNSHSELKATDYAICKDTGSSVYDKLYKFVRSGSSSAYSDETSNVTTGDFYLDTDGNMWVWDGDNFVNAGAIRGEQGDPGQSPYLHIKYANYVNGEFVFTEGGSGSEDDGEEPGDYIGMYWDYNDTDSDDPDDYVPWKYVKGQDGFGYEYIFYLENTGNAPLLPASSPNQDNYVPTSDGWTDDPGGVSASNRYCWEAWRKKTNGTWSACIRNWSEISGVSLSGDNKIFSGFEEWVEGGVARTAPFRDIIVVSPTDYPAAADCPFIYGTGTSERKTPVLLVVNYDPLGHSSGFSGNDQVILLPDSTKFTSNIAVNAAMSESYYNQGKIYSVFQNMGALYVQILVATQAYIGSLSVNHLSTGDALIGTDIYSGVFEVKKNGVVRARFGVDDAGDIVLQFLDATGTTVLYEFGPTGITSHVSNKAPSYTEIALAGMNTDVSLTPDSSDGSTWAYPASSDFVNYYIFQDGEVTVGGLTTYYVSSQSEQLTTHSQYHGKIFTTGTGSPEGKTTIANGTYLPHPVLYSSALIDGTSNKKIAYDRRTGPVANPPIGWWFFMVGLRTYADGQFQNEGTKFLFRRIENGQEVSRGTSEPFGLSVLTRVHDIRNIEGEATTYPY